MSTITKQAVQAVADLKAGYTLGHADVVILNELARIALASLEAEPAIRRWRRVTSEPYGPYPWHYGDFIGFSKPVDGIEDEYFYTSPPAPVSVPDEDLLHMAASAIEDLLSNKDRYCAGVWADIPAKLRRAAMLQGAEPVTTAYKLPEETGSSLQLRNLIRQRHAEWSQATFGDVGPVGPLKHLSKEALEAADEPEDLSEWADMQFLLWDAQLRAGISDGEITAAMEEKLKVNMARQWPEPKDGEPRLHIKEDSNSPAIPDGWVACSERMPGMGVDVLACTISPIGGFEEIETAQWHGGMKGEQPVFITSADAIEPTHWMPLPAAPLQEVK